MEIFRFVLFFVICTLSVVLMRPMPKAGILVLCSGAILLPLARAIKEAGMFSFNRAKTERRILYSEGFLIAVIFFAGATFLSAYSHDCTLAVFFWVIGLLLLFCIGNGVTWMRICVLLSPVTIRRVLTDPAFQGQILIYGVALLVALFLNFYSLTSIPYNIHGDEGEIAERARLVPFFSEFFRTQALWWHLPSPDLLLQRIGFLAGDGLWGIRAGSAFYGVVADLLIFGFLRTLVSPWLAAGCWVLIVTSPNLIQSYRQGLDIAVPLILASLFVGLVLRQFAASENRGPRMVLIGIVLGLSMVVYVSARGLLVGWGVISALMIVSAPTSGTAWRLIREIVVSWGVAFLVMGPMVSYHLANPLVPRVREEYGLEFQEDFINSRKTADWFSMVDNRVAGSISTLFTQKERIAGDFYFYFAGLLPISVVVLTFFSIASASPYFRASALMLVAAVFVFVLAMAVPLRNYDRFHRVALVFPFFAVTAAIGLDSIHERIRGEYFRLAPAVLFGGCMLIALYQVKTYFKTHSDAFEWEFVSPKTRATRTLQAVLKELPTSRVYCVAEPWFNCINGTFRLLIPGIESHAVNLTHEAFQSASIPLDSGEIVILSAGFDPLKEAGFADRLPPGTKKMEWHPHPFEMGKMPVSEKAPDDVFSGWRVPAVMPNRAPADIIITGLIIP